MCQPFRAAQSEYDFVTSERAGRSFGNVFAYHAGDAEGDFGVGFKPDAIAKAGRALLGNQHFAPTLAMRHREGLGQVDQSFVAYAQLDGAVGRVTTS